MPSGTISDSRFAGVVPLLISELIEKRTVNTLHNFFVYRPVPQSPGDLASGLFAEALHKVFYEFNIGTIRENQRKLFVYGGKYAVSAIASSVDDLNVFHSTVTMSYFKEVTNSAMTLQHQRWRLHELDYGETPNKSAPVAEVALFGTDSGAETPTT